MFPKELEDIFDEYEGDYYLRIVKVDFSGDNFIVDFVLDVQNSDYKGPDFQKWTITASGHKKNKVSFGFASFIEIKNDHPLLWEFTDTYCQLYFTGQCKNFEKLFYDLYLTHKETFGKHKCFDLSFFERTSYFKPFQYSNGLLAKGAKKLMEKYAACLKESGLDFNFVGEIPPADRNGQQAILEDLKALLMGDTYIIAEDFSFMRHIKDDR